MQSRFLAAFAGFAVLAVTLATIALSYNTVMPVADEAVSVVDIPVGYERRGPEYLSPLPQMQILTCFGTCGPACMVRS